MTTIAEDYVSFETAKLLKEKGFDDVPVYTYYLSYGGFSLAPMAVTNKDLYAHGHIAAPTLQMAMKWLREVHNIFIDISSRFSKNADKDVCFSYSCKKLIDTYKSSYEIGDGEGLNYEQACESAIKYCLKNLI